MTRFFRPARLASCCLLVPAAAAAVPPVADPLRGPVDEPVVEWTEHVGWAGRWLAIDATGVVVGVEPDDGRESWREGMADSQWRELRFEPATRDGVAVDSVVWTDVKLCAGAPDGASRVLGAWTATVRDERGPMTAPRFPSKQLREDTGGWVLVEFEVGADGRPVPETLGIADSFAFDVEGGLIDDADDTRAFETAVLGIVPKWQFRCSVLDGKALTPAIRMPVKFAFPDIPAALLQRTRARVESRLDDADDGEFTMPTLRPDAASGVACGGDPAEATP